MNKIIIASAGAGKTTFVVNDAIDKAQQGNNVLITTFTDACKEEICKKIINCCGCIPERIHIITWFSFLIRHCVKPYQGHLFDYDIKGMVLCTEKSGKRSFLIKGRPVYWGENKNFKEHYFDSSYRVYSDKLAKLAVRCNEISNGEVFRRLDKCFNYIYVDEVQDLAGYDLEILERLFDSQLDVILVGDPRQATYSTVNTEKNKKYKRAEIVNFFMNEKIDIDVDNTTLVENHRCFHEINKFANRLYPNVVAAVSNKFDESGHDGVYLLPKHLLTGYLEKFSPIQLRWNSKRSVDERYPVYTFGKSKGLTFERVVIYPSEPMLSWILNSSSPLTNDARAKLYVGLTRPTRSVAIVFEGNKLPNIDGVKLYLNT